MNTKIFVGGISWNTTSESLAETFSKFGTVKEAKVITDRESGRSRGFGFVEFEESKAANAAQEMDGQELDGRTIKVDYATAKGGGNSGRSHDNNDRNKSRGKRDRGRDNYDR